MSDIRVQASFVGTAAQHTSANRIMLAGEMSYETDTKFVKIGDGTTAWNALAYWTGGTAAVLSVNGNTGVVVLTKSSVGLSNVDNTADSAKPVSSAQATAIATAQSTAISTAQGTSAQKAANLSDLASPATARGNLGLGNVDNTSDANKPVSTAQGTAIGLKANKAGDTFTGPVIAKGTNTGDGYVNFETQTAAPATPSSGFRLFADALGRLSWKGINGFVRTFSAVGITADRVYSLPDASILLMGDVLTTIGDIFYRNSSNVTARLGIGSEDSIMRVVSGLPSWQPENLTQDFGDGSDGSLTVSGALTITQIPYYNVLTIAAGALLNTNGIPIYCKTLDLTNAPAGSIFRNGVNGASVSLNVGGSGGAALAASILGGSGAGSTGAAGATNAGVASGAPAGITPANGGAGGSSGASGAGGTGALVAAGAGGTVASYTHLGRFEYQFLRGPTQILGGAGGDGGNSGGGDGVNTSRGGGGGGGGAGALVIYAANIITGPSTPAGVIQAKGGAGGAQTAAPAAGNVGGASGAGGGGGGFIYLAYVSKTGTAVSGLVDASGGIGGNGSNALGTGVGGNGGRGGDGGTIQTFNVTTGVGAQIIGTTGNLGLAAVGTVGGSGGNGGPCVASI